MEGKSYLKSIRLSRRFTWLYNIYDQADELCPVWMDWYWWHISGGINGGKTVFTLN